MKITKQMKKELTELVEFKSTDPGKNLDNIKEYLGKVDYSVEEITEKNYPLAYQVNKGSKKRGYVVKLNYDSDMPVTLVGKGVVYDSGGMYMKPYPHMGDMFNDKYGAMLSVVLAKHHKIPTIIFLINNMVSEESYVNGEVLTSKNGLRVMIDHTDAEGRLGLADILAEASTTREGTEMVSVATLTGHAVMVVSPVKAGLLHTHNRALQHHVMDEFYKGTMLYPMPTHTLYDEGVKSERRVADITNAARKGGSQEAYSFLKNFVEEGTNLHHLDIAAMDTDDKGDVSGEGLKEVATVLKFIIKERK
jgi:leucyl aminopeptidase